MEVGTVLAHRWSSHWPFGAPSWQIPSAEVAFFGCFFPEWMSAISSTCVVVAVSEPTIKHEQLKRSFPRMFLQLHLLYRWITWGCHLIASFFPPSFLSLFQTFGIGWTTTACAVTSFCGKRDQCLPLNWTFLILQIAKSTPFALIIFNNYQNTMELYLDGKGIFSALYLWQAVFISWVLIRSMEGPSILSQLGLLLSFPVLSSNFVHKAPGFKHHPAPCVHSPSHNVHPIPPPEKWFILCFMELSFKLVFGQLLYGFPFNLQEFISSIFPLIWALLPHFWVMIFSSNWGQRTRLSSVFGPSPGALPTSAAFPLPFIFKFPFSLFHFKWRKWILMCLWYQALVLN